MEYKIAILVKEHMKVYLNNLIGTELLNSSISYFTYENFDELKTVFKELEYNYDEVLTSGYIPQRIISDICTNKVLPLNQFSINVENIYSNILKQSIIRKEFILSDIGLDFLNDTNSLYEIILNGENLSAYVTSFYDSLYLLSEEEIQNFENVLALRFIKMHNEGKIKYVLTKFYTIVEKLNENKIDCYYIYPSKAEIEHIIMLSQNEVNLKVLKNNYSSVINISFKYPDLKYSIDDNLFDMGTLKLKEALLEFGKTNNMEYISKVSNHYLEIYTDSSTVSRITNSFTNCTIYNFLSKKINFTGSIGYGIGKNIYQARLNAINAKEYDTNQNKSFLINENEEIISLSHSVGKINETVSVSTDYINKIANDVKLSSETILKVIGLIKKTGNDELSTNDIASHLNISVRTSHKILSHLYQYGYADICGQKRIGLKGRPQVVYKIKISC